MAEAVSTDAKAPRHKRREDAVDAAARVFSQRGYHGASTRHIADELGIRQGSLYYYFISKDAALEEVCRIGIEEVLEDIEALVDSDLPAEEKLGEVLGKHLAYLEQGRHYVRTFLFCRHHLPEELRGRVRAQSERYEQLVEQVFVEGVKQGIFRADLDIWVACQSYFALINIAATGFDPGDNHSITRLREGFSTQLLRGVVA